MSAALSLHTLLDMATKKTSKKSSKKAATPKKAARAKSPKRAKAPAAKRKAKAVKATKVAKRAAPKKAKAMKAMPAKKAAPKKAKALKTAPAKARATKPQARKVAPAKAKTNGAPRAGSAPKSKGRAVSRRDGSGHLDPKYAADLRRRSRSGVTPEGAAFFKGSKSDDDLAEQLGEEFLETATSGEAEGEDVLDQEVPEERGGPFIITSAGTEFADGVDASNPRGAAREPFPRT